MNALHEFVDPTGRKRKGIKVACKMCHGEFITRHDQPNECCSIACRANFKKKQIERTCAACGKCFSRKASHKTKSGLDFCSMQCKNNSQKIGGIQAIMPSHYGKGSYSHTYRRIYCEANSISVSQLACARCGYCEFECGIDIHHIDENRDNNSKDNLIALCSPCHRALHFGFWTLDGVVAQLGERLYGIQEVVGSNPIRSTV